MTPSLANPISFEERLDNSPITRTMGLLWLLSAGLIALDGFDFFIIGVALPFLKQDFGLGATAIGAVATAAVAGSLVGSLTLGPITDRVGRQLMLIVDVALFVIATAGTALAWNAASLIAFRFLVGGGHWGRLPHQRVLHYGKCPGPISRPHGDWSLHLPGGGGVVGSPDRANRDSYFSHPVSRYRSDGDSIRLALDAGGRPAAGHRRRRCAAQL